MGPLGEHVRVQQDEDRSYFLTLVWVAIWSQLLWTDSTNFSNLNVESITNDLVFLDLLLW